MEKKSSFEAMKQSIEMRFRPLKTSTSTAFLAAVRRSLVVSPMLNSVHSQGENSLTQYCVQKVYQTHTISSYQFYERII